MMEGKYRWSKRSLILAEAMRFELSTPQALVEIMAQVHYQEIIYRLIYTEGIRGMYIK